MDWRKVKLDHDISIKFNLTWDIDNLVPYRIEVYKLVRRGSVEKKM